MFIINKFKYLLTHDILVKHNSREKFLYKLVYQLNQSINPMLYEMKKRNIYI